MFLGDDTYTLRTCLENHISREDVVVLFDILAHRHDEFLHAFLEIGVNIVSQTTNHIVVENQTTTASFFKDVENEFAVAETIKERRCRTHILAQAREEEQVRVNTLQFIHDGTNHLHTIAHFHSHGLLNASAKSVTVLHRTEIVHTVGERKRLRISQFFTDFLNTAVNIAEVWIDFRNRFTVNARTEVQHTVR